MNRGSSPILRKHRAQFAQSNRGFFHFQINEIVAAIHFVAQPRDGLEQMIELQDFIDVAQAGRVNFKLDHP